MENLAEITGRGFVPLLVKRTPTPDAEGFYGSCIFRKKSSRKHWHNSLFIAALTKTRIGEPVPLLSAPLQVLKPKK